MGADERNPEGALYRRIHGELVDSLDEELEMEIDDDQLAALLTETSPTIPSTKRSSAVFISASCFACSGNS